jgi:hypothetical protein
MQMTLVMFCMFVLVPGTPSRGTELKQETAASFDRYIRAVEARLDDDINRDQFLAVDRLPDARRQQAYNQLRHGQIYIDELHARENDHSIRVPNGHIHHWVGIIFIPDATLPEASAVLHDYANQQDLYKPQVRRSQLIEQSGSDSKIYLQLFNDAVVTVVLNAYFDVNDVDFGSIRHQIEVRSTRIAEVANPGKPDEQERPPGNDHRYMWRFNIYWRVEEKDGGVYVQNESVVLSRTSPAVLAWLINLMTKKIPRNILLNLLKDARNAAMSSKGHIHSSLETDRASEASHGQ